MLQWELSSTTSAQSIIIISKTTDIRIMANNSNNRRRGREEEEEEAPARAQLPDLVDGLMTPRMYERLKTCAAVSADICVDNMPEFTNYEAQSMSGFCEVMMMDHVPRELRREV
jgi:dephospho-CoA kinase